VDQAHRAVALSLLSIAACGGEVEPPPITPDDNAALPYVQEIVSFLPGTNAGYGQDRAPKIVMGPPTGKGLGAGSIDTLSLGIGGEIVLGFGDRIIVDGPGPDFVVFENAFWVNGVRGTVYAELGDVSVSEDGATWHEFACDSTRDARMEWPGCAGWSPALEYDALVLDPLDAVQTGGDAFDLATIGVSEARFVRIRDRASDGEPPTAGFDLDAVGLIRYRQQ